MKIETDAGTAMKKSLKANGPNYPQIILTASK
jgi:hypothetical protein